MLLEDKKTLLFLARSTLERYVKLQQQPTLEELGIGLSEVLAEPCGVFVTLYSHLPTGTKLLRGCIGYVDPIRPLYQAVIENTVNACSRDSRFAPVREEELPHLSIDINILTAPRPISSYKEIRLGVDGIVLLCHGRRGVFLPSVPGEMGWNLEQTLSALAEKAKLPATAWLEPGAAFQVFQSERLCEK